MEINNNKTHKMDPDPFKVRLEFTKSDYVRMALMGVTILPIRILGKNNLPSHFYAGIIFF